MFLRIYLSISTVLAAVTAVCFGLLAGGWSYCSQPKFTEAKVIENPAAELQLKSDNETAEKGNVTSEDKQENNAGDIRRDNLKDVSAL